MEKEVEDPGGPVWLAARKKKQKNSAESRRKRREKEAKWGPYVEGCKKDVCTTRWW